ncbi:hypothetical protein B9Z55_013491 [Caenorhabditis nigoni]|uniref:F-box associated domain-containing protein n=1 Tax=Caenorhabditis nigoni TaxID=1611254 RepID=A0A2G5U268_9PELO|nr:hypothetical protein B9Z55_013491 [Caenorhabditis nigoni]
MNIDVYRKTNNRKVDSVGSLLPLVYGSSTRCLLFRIHGVHQSTIASSSPHKYEFVLESIHNYIMDLFGTSMEYDWKMYTNDKKLSIPQLQNLSGCAIIQYQNFVDWVELELEEHFFSSSPVLKWIHMQIGSLKEFSPDSKFYMTESIDIFKIDGVLDLLRYFQGRQAFLNACRYESSDFIEFVKRWKSGNAFQKLEYFYCNDHCSYESMENEVLNAVAKYIDTTKKPPTHTLPLVHVCIDNKPNTNPITSYAYVVRETDGHVASILFQETMFRFGVWDKTEEEFLAMVE